MYIFKLPQRNIANPTIFDKSSHARDVITFVIIVNVHRHMYTRFARFIHE